MCLSIIGITDSENSYKILRLAWDILTKTQKGINTMRDEKFQQDKKPDESLIERVRTAFTDSRVTSTPQPPPMSHINRRDAEAEEERKKNHNHDDEQNDPIQAPSRKAQRKEREIDEVEQVAPRKEKKKEKREIVEERIERRERLNLFQQPRETALRSHDQRTDPRMAMMKPSRSRVQRENLEGNNAPIRFTGIPLEEQKKQYNAAMLRAANATDDFYSFLKRSGIEALDLPIEQQEEIEKYEQDIVKKAVLGTLTDKEKNSIFDSIQEFFETLFGGDDEEDEPVTIERIQEERMTFLPKTTIELAKKTESSKYVMPELGLVETDVLAKEDLDQILRYGEKHSDDPIQNATYEKMRAYKQEIFEQANDAYNAAIESGAVKPYDYRRFYDHAVLEMYETCLKPIPVQNQKGTVKSSKAIGELIYPFDNSLGANVAREALNQLGVPYEDMDCSQLVKRAFYNLNEDWGKHGIGNHAGYQRNRIAPYWTMQYEDINSKTIDYNALNLKTGDLLYWEDDEGNTIHTAIYLSNGYMIEAWKSVRITELRIETSLGGGKKSKLVQVNRVEQEALD